uniref:Aldose 1-epimerase n=1 Tax=Leersia perrieri TaxID=77586 RepID=A0A0D9VVR6_9ORYZ
MEQLVGVHHHHSSSSSSLSPRTPTHAHTHLLRIPSNRLRPAAAADHLHHPSPHHTHPSPHAASKALRVTPPFFLVLLAAVYLLASFTIFSSPAASLRPSSSKNRAKLLLPMADSSSSSSSVPPSTGLELFELDGGRIRAWISNVGATVTSLLVPDKNGVLGDVVLGFDSLDPYLDDAQLHMTRFSPFSQAALDRKCQVCNAVQPAGVHIVGQFPMAFPFCSTLFKNGTSPYFGCIVGRVANRIKDGKFTLNDMQYSLAINNPPNTLHGGFKGFDKIIWEVAEYIKGENPSITFKYYSKDGEEGFPGDLSVTARYSILASTTLKLEMEAIPLNKATPISLAQHTYWNLAGHNSGDVLAHSVQIWGSQITPVDQTSIPTGEMVLVSGTPFDFLTESTIGSRIDQVPGGYDHNFVLDCGEVKSGLRHVAKVTDTSSLRVLDIWADAPGVQFYTGNFLNGIVGKGGAVYGKHAGLCLETQGFPNAVNQPNFPSVVVQPGEKYSHTMLFEFSTK